MTGQPMKVSIRIQIVAASMVIALAISIPVMSSYGLKVCPVLLPMGFGFGCQYLVLFAVNLVILNAIFLRKLVRSLSDEMVPISYDKLHAAPRRSAWAYLAAYLLTVLELLVILKLKHVSHQSRGPEVLAIMVLLLATLQYYGIAWAVLPASTPEESAPPQTGSRRIWTHGALRVTIPALISAVIGIHFLLRSAGLAHLLGVNFVAPENPLGTSTSLP